MLKRIFVFLSMALVTVAYAQTSDQVVNDVMQAYLQKNEIPGAAVMVVVDGKPSSYFYGYADRETKNR